MCRQRILNSQIAIERGYAAVEVSLAAARKQPHGQCCGMRSIVRGSTPESPLRSHLTRREEVLRGLRPKKHRQ